MTKEEIIELLKNPDVVSVIKECINVSCWRMDILDEYGYPTPYDEIKCKVSLFGNELYKQ